MSFERILFVQHGLSKTTGHWLAETNEWRLATHKLNMKWVGFAHKNLDPSIATVCGVKPVFNYRPFDAINATPMTAKLATFIELAEVFRITAQQHFPNDVSSKDLLLIPFATDVEVYGVAKWMDTLHPQRRPSVAFVFHHFNLTWKTNVKTLEVKGDYSSWEYAARALSQRLPPEKILYCGVGDALSKALTQIFNVRTRHVPLISRFPTQAAPALKKKTYDIGILGGARYEQGSEVWVPVLKDLARLRPDLKVAIQAANNEQKANLRAKLGDVLPASRLNIHVGGLTDADYYTRMLSSRLLFLPYMPERYCFRESGVFIEACGSGIPCVVTPNTSMARHIQSKRAAGVIFKNNTLPSISQSLNSALDNTELLYKQAASVSEKWRKLHNAETILKTLCGSFKPAKAVA